MIPKNILLLKICGNYHHTLKLYKNAIAVLDLHVFLLGEDRSLIFVNVDLSSFPYEILQNHIRFRNWFLKKGLYISITISWAYKQ